MGRPKNDGLGYFPLDTGFFEDKRIRRLIARFGSDGPLFYLYILCRAYSGGYKVEYDDYFVEDAALDLGCGAEKIDLMLHYLLDKSMLLDGTLFNTVKVLSSHGIQSQYQAIKKSLKRDVEVDGNSWILNESETEGFIKVRHFENKSGRNPDKSGRNSDKSEIYAIKESKVKESKVKESKGKEKENCDTVIATVFSAYFEKIGDRMTDNIKNELTLFAKTMGADCCIRAMDAAIEANKISWQYVRKVLAVKRDQGVRCIADWDRKEEEYRGSRKSSGGDSARSGEDGKRWNLEVTKL